MFAIKPQCRQIPDLQWGGARAYNSRESRGRAAGGVNGQVVIVGLT